MNEPIDQIKEPGQDTEFNCDCSMLARWQTYARVLAVFSLILVAGVITMGLQLRARSNEIEFMKAKFQVTPAEVIERLKVTPAHVLSELQLYRAEQQEMRKTLDEIQKKLACHALD